MLSGATDPVYGIFDPVGEAASPFGSEVGLVGIVSAQANPVLTLLDADAAGLAQGDTLTVRGVSYVVSGRPRTDGAGMTRIELMPATRSAAEALATYR